MCSLLPRMLVLRTCCTSLAGREAHDLLLTCCASELNDHHPWAIITVRAPLYSTWRQGEVIGEVRIEVLEAAGLTNGGDLIKHGDPYVMAMCEGQYVSQPQTRALGLTLAVPSRYTVSPLIRS